MLVRIAMLLGLASAVLCAAVVDDEAAANREGKFWWPEWWGTDCTTAFGYGGSCYNDYECFKRGGTSNGTCAQDQGMCCDLLSGGATTISASGEYFSNKGNPETDDKAGVTVAELSPPAGTVQVKLDFEDFMLTPPVEGECGNDTFVFEGANPGLEIPVLCGYNTGQHMYIDVDNTEGPWKLIVTTSGAEYARSWKIKVHFLTRDSMERAPFRCLQFYPEESGEMMSFNYNPDGDSMMLNNQLYSICFGYVRGFCDIAITGTRLDLGPIGASPASSNCGNDYIRVGYNTFCGDTAGNSVTVNSTGPIIMQVSSDEDNSDEEEGFLAKYLMMMCS